MKKQQNIIKEERSDISDILNEHPYIQWISDNRKDLVIGFLTFIALIFLILKITTGGFQSGANEYLQAENDFLIFQRGAMETNDPTKREEALDDLKGILKKYPNLHPKYDGLIAQNLLLQGDLDDASHFVNLALNRTNDDLPQISDFTKATLLISKEKYQEALNDSEKLKVELNKNEPLYGFNLLRIALLHQKLDHPQQELDAWNEWNNNSFEQIEQTFKDGNITLADYIAEREKVLNKFK